jgi:fatty acid/phospholipid biosynthesis enzyme
MNIALDMMGGDFAPEELVKAVRDYLSEKKTCTCIADW